VTRTILYKYCKRIGRKLAASEHRTQNLAITSPFLHKKKLICQNKRIEKIVNSRERKNWGFKIWLEVLIPGYMLKVIDIIHLVNGLIISSAIITFTW